MTPTLPTQVTPPRFTLVSDPADQHPEAQVIALPVLPGDAGPMLGPGAERLAERLGIDLLEVLSDVREPATPGTVTAYRVPATGALREVLLIGVGSADPAALRRAGAALARAVRRRRMVITTLPAVAGPAALQEFVAGAILGSFGFHWSATPPTDPPAEQIMLAGLPTDADLSTALRRGVAAGAAGWRARLLATVPSNLKNPQWLADQAERVAADTGLACTVWDEKELRRRGMGGLLGVGAASATPPRLVRLDYTPPRAGRRTPLVVLVGKGITFDSGGLSIKPGEAMTTMKRDMTGAAVVLATLAALGEFECPVRVTGLLALAENAVSGTSMRPGDVITHFGGRTTEVTNTDAEGRLVLADALAFAVAELQPAAVVDVATLTGAIKIALGQRVGGLFANREELAAALAEAGRRAGEPLWRFPLDPVYEPKIASKVADADNAGGGPGAITAALFLQHFVAGVPWAHLDLASVGDSPSESFEWTQGPTGFGSRALLAWLGGPDPLAGLPRRGGRGRS